MSRGRVVMLVYNTVEGDSRVQKQAESAAAAGWDVTLVGLLGFASSREQWTIGEAKVNLVQVRSILAQGVRLRRSLRRPLAYRPGPAAGYRRQVIRTKQTEVVDRMSRSEPVWRVLPARAALKVQRPWMHFRTAQTRALEDARKNPDAFWTKASIWYRTTFWGSRSWRHLDPALVDLEIAFAPVIDELEPDIIHANDAHMLGVGANAKMRAAARGDVIKLVWDAHELISGVVPPRTKPNWLPAQIAIEREYVPYADAAITVSPMLADLLVSEHKLKVRPSVVMNAPKAFISAGEAPDLRKTIGVGPEAPVIAYSGGIAKQRGMRVVVEALPKLPGVHVVMLSLHPNGVRTDADVLEEQAASLGVADRVHILPYLEHHQVVKFLTGADAAVSPLEHTPNHEVALTNKMFEFAQARLPQIVSDVKSSADLVNSTGIGEVFIAGDVDDFVRAARAVLDDLPRYQKAYEKPGMVAEWTWERQAEILDGVYRDLHLNASKSLSG